MYYHLIGEDAFMAKRETKLFDAANVPTWLEKNRKKHNIATILLAFVIVPICSILLVALTCKSVGLRVVETSISKLAWEYGYLSVAFVWGIINLALFMYLTVLAVNSCGFNLPAKKAFISLEGISIALMLTGISIPFLPGDANRTPRFFHNFFATLSFVMFAAIVIILCVMLLFRDRRQGIGACAFMAFIVITGIFFIPQVNAQISDAFVTAAAQLYIFMILEILLAMIYLTQPFFDRYSACEKQAATCDNVLPCSYDLACDGSNVASELAANDGTRDDATD